MTAATYDELVVNGAHRPRNVARQQHGEYVVAEPGSVDLLAWALVLPLLIVFVLVATGVLG